MNPMATAPKHCRILLKYKVRLFRPPTREDHPDLNLQEFRRISGRSDWYDSGEKWEECFWDLEYEFTPLAPVGSTDIPTTQYGRWTPWCGNARTKSTDTINYPLGWLPLPEDVEPKPQKRFYSRYSRHKQS